MSKSGPSRGPQGEDRSSHKLADVPLNQTQLNVAVSRHLTELAKSLKCTLIYISTGEFQGVRCFVPAHSSRLDYVFDGTSPPYLPSSITHPVNLYGTTKRDGELAVLGVEGAKATVLRVPVL